MFSSCVENTSIAALKSSPSLVIINQDKHTNLKIEQQCRQNATGRKTESINREARDDWNYITSLTHHTALLTCKAPSKRSTSCWEGEFLVSKIFNSSCRKSLLATWMWNRKPQFFTHVSTQVRTSIKEGLLLPRDEAIRFFRARMASRGLWRSVSPVNELRARFESQVRNQEH